MAKQMTMGVMVGNRGFFPSHLATSGRLEMVAALEAAGIKPGTVKVAIPTPHAFAKSFNTDARIVAIQQAYPTAPIKVPVPHVRIFGVPLP